MILCVRTGATPVCKFLQCYCFGNSRRKLVALEGSEVQHQVLIGGSLVGKDGHRCQESGTQLSFAAVCWQEGTPCPSPRLLGKGEVLEPLLR